MNNMIPSNLVSRFIAPSLLLLLIACGGDSSSHSDVSQAENSTDGSDDAITTCDITLDNQEMLNQVNLARGSSRACGDGQMPAVAELGWNCQLRAAAQGHSGDMAKKNFFDHTGSDGLSVSDRVTASGYSWDSVGENIAAGQSNIAQVMVGWLDSPGHCRNIMSSSFAEFGSALVTNNESDYPTYWTQVFARAR